MRLFTAIDLDVAARSAIAKEQKRIAAAIGRGPGQRGPRTEKMTWVAVDRMHLTLVFLGEVPDAAAAPLVDAMQAPIARAPFDIRFEGVGVFPPEGARKPPKVLWLGVSDGAEAVTAVQRDVAARLAALGAVLEDRAFHPHLTLARWRRSAWSDRRRVADAGRPGVVARVRVDGATLYQSRLSSSGPSYTPLARANLSG